MTITRTLARSAAIGLISCSVSTASPTLAWQAAATPTATCQPPQAAGSPVPTMHGDMSGMETAMPEMPLEMLYIDMMIPHHASVIALSEVALPDLQDARLRTMAEEIIATQGTEIEDLKDLRESLYDEREPMPMDSAMMVAMAEAMPDMGSDIQGLAIQMDTAAQVAAICAAEDVDAAFIAQIIPHHQMAIDASRAVLASSQDATLRAIAEKVIAAQQSEIDLLHEMQQESEAVATPTT